MIDVQTWLFLAEFDTARLTEPDILIRLVIQVILLALSCFFSMSETALFSLSPMDLQRLQRENHPQAGVLRRLLDEPRQLIISILCGNELINIAASVNLAGVLLALSGSTSTAALFNILVMFPLLLLFCEITPKTIAMSNPVKLSTTMVARPILLWKNFSAPLRWLVRQVSDRITTLLVGQDRTEDHLLGVDEFRSLLSKVEEEGVVTGSERTLIENLIELGETEIREIMTPRPRVPFISADLPVPEIIARFRKLRKDRVPVYRGHRDVILGFLHSEDLVKLMLNDKKLEEMKIDEILRPAVIVPPTKKVDEMFDYFSTHHCRAAAVVSEFGGVDGFLEMRDILRFLFDEFTGQDEEPGLYDREPDSNVAMVSGLLKLDDFNYFTDANLDDPQMTTIGGFVFRHLDRLPQEGDVVVLEGMAFTVVEMEGNLIQRMRVQPAAEVEAEATVEEEMEVTPSDPEEAP